MERMRVPFMRENGGNLFRRAGNGLGKEAGAEGGTVDEEVELVSGTATMEVAGKGDAEDTVIYAGRSYCCLFQRAIT